MSTPVVTRTVAPAKAVDRLAKLEAAAERWLAAKETYRQDHNWANDERWNDLRLASENLERVAREVREKR